MKNMRKMVAIVSMLAMSCTSVLPAQAAKIVVSGNTEAGAVGVTALVVNSESNVKSLSKDEIFWIDQQKVDENGKFTIALPEFDMSKYKLYTNASIYNFEEGKTVYVSAGGDAKETGESKSKPTTFENAVKNIDLIKEIILLDDISYKSTNLPGNVVIKGDSSEVRLDLSGTVYLSDKLKLDNLIINTETTFVANGYAFEITDTVTSTKQLIVYGGGNGKDVENTNLKIDGGSYSRIYGGGKSSGVLGKTNVTIDGNADADYVMGAGYGENTWAKETNIYIKGGKIMNVYGGSDGTEMSGTNTHITMTGGIAEAIFGGSASAGLTGNTYVKLLGGEITRRVYTGCYNGRSLSWDGTCHVTGTTTLTLTPEMEGKLSTGNGLSLGDSSNMGVFAGSRVADNHSDEHNTIIYADDCYDALKDEVAGTSGFLTTFKSHTDYVVKAGKNGQVIGTEEGGVVEIVPDNGKYGCVNATDEIFFANERATLNSGDNTVVFEDLVSVEKKDDGIAAKAAINCAEEGKLIAAVFDMSGIFISCNYVDYVVETDSYNIDVPCKLNKNESYTVKILLWDSFTEMIPLMNGYSIVVR